jgi:hypothetical protein
MNHLEYAYHWLALQVATSVAAAGIREFTSEFPSSVSYPLDLSGLGDPTGSNATAGLALRVKGTHKPVYHGNVEIHTYSTTKEG